MRGKRISLYASGIAIGAAVSASAAAEPDYFYTFYLENYLQAGPTTLLPDPGNPAQIQLTASTAFIDPSFTQGTVSVPGSGSFLMQGIPLTWGQGYDSLSDLILACPAGEYRFLLSGGTKGPLDVRITLPALSSFRAKEALFSASQWNTRTLVNAAADLIIDLSHLEPEPAYPDEEIYINVLLFPFQYQTLVHAPLSNGFVILPAGSMSPGLDYILLISRDRTISVPISGDADAVATVFSSKTTTLLIRTNGGACIGDLNQDGLIDDADFVLFVAAYDVLDCRDFHMFPWGCPSDLNGDALVDDADFVVFIPGYNDLVCP